MAARVNGPRIKPQPRLAFEPCSFKIDSTTRMKLKVYCELSSEQSYVIREALNYLFESDAAFQQVFASLLESGASSDES
jgi:hypothetical protein